MGGALIARLRKLYTHAQELAAEKSYETLHESADSWVHSVAHLCIMAVRSFFRNRCPVRATALSYTTLLALVPLLAVAVSVTSSFLQQRGRDASDKLIAQLVQAAAPQLELFSQTDLEGEHVDARQKVVDQIGTFIGNFHSKAVGGTGLLAVIVVALLLMSTIEGAFNDIWGVSRGRAWFHRLVTYWTTISLGPMMVVMAFVLTQGTEFRAAQHFIAKMPFLSTLVFGLLPFAIISLSFALLYKLMPNTHVHWRAALTAGAVGGCCWLLLNLFNASNLGRVIQMSHIYGPLAIIPIFLIGLYFSWLVVLFGAQVSYTLQNRKIYLQERRAVAVSQTGREYIALRLMAHIGQRFAASGPPMTLTQLTECTNISSRLAVLVLQQLLAANLIAELNCEEPCYVPSRPLEDITCHDVLMALRSGRKPDIEPGHNRDGDLILDAFARIQASEREIAAAITLKELAQHLVPCSSRSPMGDTTTVTPATAAHPL